MFCNGVYQDYTLLDYSSDKVMDSRFKKMSINIWNVLDMYNPKIIYIEEMVVNRNPQTQRFLVRLQGIVYAWCMKNDCEFNTIRPNIWRSSLGLQKQAKRNELKQLAMDYVLKHYKLDVCDDVADAICIGDAVLTKFE